MNQQTATIELSRSTLERLQSDFWTLTFQENEQVNNALEVMQANDKLETINKVPNPKGTFSHPAPKIIND